MTDRTQPDSDSTYIIRYALELGLLWIDGDGRNKVREALDALDALEAKLASIGAGGVQALSAAPAGWKLVPVEPDISMQIAAKKADMDHSPLPDWLVSDWPEFLHIWHSMLAASPTPPAEQQAAPKAAPQQEAQEPVAYALKWPNVLRLNLSTVFDTEAEALEYLERCSPGVAVVPLYTNPAAPPADSVLEDAARYRYLTMEHGDLCIVRDAERGSGCYVLKAGAADAAIDAARKQGANHD